MLSALFPIVKMRYHGRIGSLSPVLAQGVLVQTYLLEVAAMHNPLHHTRKVSPQGKFSHNHSNPRWKPCAIGLLASMMVFLVGCGSSMMQQQAYNASNPCSINSSGQSMASPASSGPAATTVQVTFSNQGPMPMAAAMQIGTGNWTSASVQNGQLSIPLPAGTQQFAFAYVCPAYTVGQIVLGPQVQKETESIDEFTLQDGTAFTVSCPAGPNSASSANAVTLQADATAIAGTFSIDALGPLGGQTSPGNKTAVVADLQTGTNDIALLALDSFGNPLAVKILRNQTYPGTINGGNPVVFAASDATSTQTISFANIPSGTGPDSYPSGLGNYITANGTQFPIYDTDANMPTPTSSYTVVPASEAQAGDTYSISVQDTLQGNSSMGPTQLPQVKSAITMTSAQPVTLEFPDLLPSTDVTNVTALPSFPLYGAGYSNSWFTYYKGNVSWGVSSPNDSVSTTCSTQAVASSSYQNGNTTLAIPDISSIPGFFTKATGNATLVWNASVSSSPHPQYSGTSQTTANPVESTGYTGGGTVQ